MFQQRLMIQGDRLTHVLHQPSRHLILDTAARMRLLEPMRDREGLGRWALSIPFEDWVALRRKHPELASTDAHVKTRAYLRFMASDESKPYRVRERV